MNGNGVWRFCVSSSLFVNRNGWNSTRLVFCFFLSLPFKFETGKEVKMSVALVPLSPYDTSATKLYEM